MLIPFLSTVTVLGRPLFRLRLEVAVLPGLMHVRVPGSEIENPFEICPFAAGSKYLRH